MLLRDSIWDINGLISYRETTKMGLGVFSNRDIGERTEILCEPVRTFKGRDAELLRQTDAYRMMFVDRTSYEDNTGNPPIHLVLGAISMLNHGDDENCVVCWELDDDKPEKSRVRLVAAKDIKSGEQLLMRYHNVDEYDFS